MKNEAFILPFLALLVLSPLGTMFWYDPVTDNDPFELYVNVRGLDHDADDVHVKAFIPDLNIEVASREFDLDRNENCLVYLIPNELAGAKTAHCPVNGVARNDEGVRDSRYIWFTVE